MQHHSASKKEKFDISAKSTEDNP